MCARLAGGSGAGAVVSDPLVDGDITGGECYIGVFNKQILWNPQ